MHARVAPPPDSKGSPREVLSFLVTGDTTFVHKLGCALEFPGLRTFIPAPSPKDRCCSAGLVWALDIGVLKASCVADMQGSLERTAVIAEQFALCAFFLSVFWLGFYIFIIWDFLKFLSFYINHCKNLFKFDFCSIFCLLKFF